MAVLFEHLFEGSLRLFASTAAQRKQQFSTLLPMALCLDTLRWPSAMLCVHTEVERSGAYSSKHADAGKILAAALAAKIDRRNGHSSDTRRPPRCC